MPTASASATHTRPFFMDDVSGPHSEPKSSLNSGIQSVGYILSYGVVYSAAFLVELIPSTSCIRLGIEEGSRSALEDLKQISKSAGEKSSEVPETEQAAERKPRASRKKKTAKTVAP